MTKNYSFNDFEINLLDSRNKAIHVSRSSISLSKIIRNLKGKDILDLGCGAGYMTIGSLLMGARTVTAVDIENSEKVVRKNLKLNNLPQNKLRFIKSDLFDKIPVNSKFDVIIANLPQHALPAVPASKELSGKYGGFDGSEIVCKALSESTHFLRRSGRYYCSVSELANYHRTRSFIRLLYKISSIHKDIKNLPVGEMLPYITNKQLLKHLKNLKNAHLINTKIDLKYPVVYKVKRYELIKKEEGV